MYSFLQFIDSLKSYFPVHLEIAYNRFSDWTIYVYKKACASEYPGCECSGDDVIICDEQHSDMEFAFAKAHVAVKEWLLEHNGGY